MATIEVSAPLCFQSKNEAHIQDVAWFWKWLMMSLEQI